MSGRKQARTSTPRHTISRARASITNQSAIINNLQSSLNSANATLSNERRRFQNTLQRRERSFQNSVNGLRSSMGAMERRYMRSLNKQTKQLNKSIKKQGLEFNRRLLKERDERRKDLQQQKVQLERSIQNAVGQERAEREKQIRRLEVEIDNIERELRNEINRVEEEFDTKINIEKVERQKAINSLRDWTEESLKQQRAEYLEIAEEQQKQLNELRNDVSQIFAKEQLNQQAAIEFITDLEKQIEWTKTNLPHNRFTPGELGKIRRNTQDAKNDVSVREQAAIANAKKAYFELVDLRDEIHRREHEFNLWHNAAMEAATALFETVRSNREVELENNAGSVEVDFWTYGRYSELEKEVNALKERLENERETITLEEVKSSLDQLDQLGNRQEVLVKEGVERVISSQIRAEIGDVVVDAMKKQGFTLTKSGYEKEDQRKVYLLELKSESGTEIVAAVVPDDETNKNTLSINTRDERAFSDVATVERFEAIKKILTNSGIDVGTTECYDEHIEELYDLDNILKQGGKGIPKSVLEKANLLNQQTNV